MNLKVLGTGSKGNCYLFTDNNGESIMIECGVPWKEILKGIDFDPSNLLACFISHGHGDHSKSHKYVADLGVDIYCSKECGEQINAYHFVILENNMHYRLGDYIVNSFDLKHDVPCKGFTISHPECGNIVFITDTIYSPYRFENVNHFLIEANYCEEHIKNSVKNDWLRNRIVNSHMSIQNCVDFIKLNDNSNLYTVILTHLSDSNSIEHEFIDAVKKDHSLTEVYAANNGFEINLSNNPF